jgi:hypothetical protein
MHWWRLYVLLYYLPSSLVEAMNISVTTASSSSSSFFLPSMCFVKEMVALRTGDGSVSS